MASTQAHRLDADLRARGVNDESSIMAIELEQGKPVSNISVTHERRVCACGECPQIPKRLLYRGQENAILTRYEDPLADCRNGQERQIARRMACHYHIEDDVKVLEKAAMWIQDERAFMHTVADDDSETGSSIQERRPSQTEASPPEIPRGTTTDDQQDELVPTQQERDAIKTKTSLGFWDQPRAFQSLCAMLFIAAILQGWNQTAANGANVCWLDPLITQGNAVAGTACTNNYEYKVKYGVISAAPFLFAPVGCILSDPLNEIFFGRRRAILLSASLILATAIASAFMRSFGGLLVCRALLGVGMGAKASVVPVFLAEIAPSNFRGSLIMNWQVFDALGIFLGFTANLLAAQAEASSSWRWQMASSAIPAFALLVSFIFVPYDSPRFLMKTEEERYRRYVRTRTAHERRRTQNEVTLNGNTTSHRNGDVVKPVSLRRRAGDVVRYQYTSDPAYGYRSRTYDTLLALRRSPILAARELLFTHMQVLIQRLSETGDQNLDADINFSVSKSRGWFFRTKDLFSDPVLRRQLLAAGVMMAAQQLCGINVLVFYSSLLFSSAGDPTSAASNLTPIFISWAIGLINFIFALPAYWWIETQGRRWLVLVTLPFLSITLGAAAGCFAISNPTTREALVAVLTFVFTALYSFGLGPIPFTLSAEIFPLDHRMVGMSLAVSLNLVLGGAFTLVVPLINRYILLGIFSFTNLVAWVLVYVFVREPERPGTQSRSRALRLEEVFLIYQPGFKKHLRFLWKYKKQALRRFLNTLRFKSTAGQDRAYFLDYLEETEQSDR